MARLRKYPFTQLYDIIHFHYQFECQSTDTQVIVKHSRSLEKLEFVNPYSLRGGWIILSASVNVQLLLSVFTVSLLASEIQMMALPHAQYVLADAGTPVTAAANSSQVKTVRHWCKQEFCLCVYIYQLKVWTKTIRAWWIVQTTQFKKKIYMLILLKQVSNLVTLKF